MSNKSLAAVLGRGLAAMARKTTIDGYFPTPIGTREAGLWGRWAWNTGATYSGKTVTPDTALQNDTVWSCVKLISEAVSTLPLGFYKRTANGGRESAHEHPLYELLHSQPSARMSAVNYWQANTASLLLWGNAYTEIKRASTGRIISLEFMNPERVRLTRGADGILNYTYVFGTQERQLRREDVMHIKSFSLDGEIGLSAIQYGRNNIGGAMAADQAADETFRDASKASGMVQVDAMLTREQRGQIGAHIQDVSRNGGVYVLEKGMNYTNLRFSPADAELLSSRSFSVETICRWFRVPPVMIGHGDKQSSWPTSTDAQGALFVRYVLRACILGIEQEIRRALLTPAERNTYFAEFSVEGLLRGDTAARSAFYATALQNGYMSSNEVRALENLPPVPGGDVLRVQSNLVPLQQLGQASAESAARAALLAWLNTEKETQP